MVMTMSDEMGSSGDSPLDSTSRDYVDSLKSELERVVAERDRYREELQALRSDQLSGIQSKLKYIGDRVISTQRKVHHLPGLLLTELQAMQQLLHRFSPEATLPALAGWALSPTGLLALTDLVQASEARLVVECGSGTSTLWLAYAMRRNGVGKVVALDHLPQYAERTRSMIHSHGLDAFVEVRDAPLVPRSTPRGEYMWYDFDPASLNEPVDVLVVDGPPGDTGPHARYPALPIFEDCLAKEARILMDDVDRRDEQEVLDVWLSQDPRVKRLQSPGAGMELLSFSR